MSSGSAIAPHPSPTSPTHLKAQIHEKLKAGKPVISVIQLYALQTLCRQTSYQCHSVIYSSENLRPANQSAALFSYIFFKSLAL